LQKLIRKVGYWSNIQGKTNIHLPEFMIMIPDIFMSGIAMMAKYFLARRPDP
jgi:hypothetical protein